MRTQVIPVFQYGYPKIQTIPMCKISNRVTGALSTEIPPMLRIPPPPLLFMIFAAGVNWSGLNPIKYLNKAHQTIGKRVGARRLMRSARFADTLAS
jgi:hypothetical protein